MTKSPNFFKTTATVSIYQRPLFVFHLKEKKNPSDFRIDGWMHSSRCCTWWVSTCTFISAEHTEQQQQRSVTLNPLWQPSHWCNPRAFHITPVGVTFYTKHPSRPWGQPCHAIACAGSLQWGLLEAAKTCTFWWTAHTFPLPIPLQSQLGNSQHMGRCGWWFVVCVVENHPQWTDI